MRALYVFFASCLAMALTASAEDRVVCYYGNWASGRPGHGKVTPDDIDASLCTHFIWSFVLLSGNQVGFPVDQDNLVNFIKLRQRNPAAKILIAVGGYNDSQEKNYSGMAASPESRKKFIESVVTLLNKFHLDGFDVDWEYPNASDRENFVILLKEMKESFKKHGFLLTAAVGAPEWRANQSYNIAAISQYLDFINLMTYDFHGTWEQQTGHHAGLHGQLSVESCVNYWLKNGCPREKLVVGVPTYGRTWTLSNPQSNGIDAPATGAGVAGPYVREAGSLGYNEICEDIRPPSWTIQFDNQAQAPFAYRGNQWVSYDNVKSVTEKAKYIRKLGLGGAMIWAIETDDTVGACGDKFPILKALNAVLRDGAPVSEEFITPAVDEMADQPNSYPDQGQQSYPDEGTGQCIQAGNMPDPGSCGFISCRNNGDGGFIAAAMACPSGLCYNVLNDICDWPKKN